MFKKCAVLVVMFFVMLFSGFTPAVAQDFTPVIVSPNQATVATAGGNRDLFVYFAFIGGTSEVLDVHFGIKNINTDYSWGMFDGAMFVDQPYTFGRIPVEAPPGLYVVLAGVADGYGNPYHEIISEVFEIVSQPTVSRVSPYPVGIGNTVTLYGSGFRDFNYIGLSVADDSDVSIFLSNVRSYDNSSLSFTFPADFMKGSGEDKKGQQWVHAEPGIYKYSVSTDAGGTVEGYVYAVYPEVRMYEDLHTTIHHPGDFFVFHFDAQGLEKGQLVLHEVTDNWYDVGASWVLGSDVLDGGFYWGDTLPGKLPTGNYELEVVGDGGIATAWSSVFRVEVPTPMTSLQAAVTTNDLNYTVYTGQGATFTCLTTGGSGVYTYDWTGFDVSKVSNDQAYIGAFTTPGLHMVMCTVTSNYKGGSDSVTIGQRVLVIESEVKEVPSGIRLYQVPMSDRASILFDPGINIPVKYQRQLQKLYAAAIKAGNKKSPKGVMAK